MCVCVCVCVWVCRNVTVFPVGLLTTYSISQITLTYEYVSTCVHRSHQILELYVHPNSLSCTLAI